MKLPIYELKINDAMSDEAEVNYVALVDAPAIKKDFIAFKEEFIEPSKGEHETDFIPRCIAYVVNEGKDTEQATAICYSVWEQHFAEGMLHYTIDGKLWTGPTHKNSDGKLMTGKVHTEDSKYLYHELEFAESYNDYPKKASENAQAALNYAEKNGWGDCGEATGKNRANQLAKGEKLSRETIARMSSFERQRQNSNKALGDGCGRLMWLAWGGDEGIEWATKKLAQIDKFAGTKVSIDYDDTLSTERGKELAKRLIANGDVVYIISARQDKEGMLSVAKELGIPESRVYATGSNKAKVEKITSLDISKHYDNNADVVKELGSKGEKFKMGFAITNEDEHIISGCLMEADLPIYRNNEKFGEHYVVFSADTIKQIAIKFAKKHYQSNVNLMHDANKVVDGCTMFESFIVDKSRGIMPMQGFEGIADGSWFGSFYVENPKVWERIKSGELKGFSVEGMFDYEIPIDSDQQKLKEIELLLNSLI